MMMGRTMMTITTSRAPYITTNMKGRNNNYAMMSRTAMTERKIMMPNPSLFSTPSYYD